MEVVVFEVVFERLIDGKNTRYTGAGVTNHAPRELPSCRAQFQHNLPLIFK